MVVTFYVSKRKYISCELYIAIFLLLYHPEMATPYKPDKG